MFTVIIFILVLGLLVFVHELGHFVVARRNDVEVQEFGFGFPPRIVGYFRNENGQKKIFFGNGEPEGKNTVYSVNWIPLGGFVKIVGEDGDQKENPNSFASKSPFARIRILAAGVAMNFLLAVGLFALSFYLGVPQPVDEVTTGKIGNEKIQILEVGKDTPAQIAGIRPGDELKGINGSGGTVTFSSVEEVQQYIAEHKGQKIIFNILRGKEELKIEGVPRENYPEGEGPLGISLAKIVEVRYSWYQALLLGLKYTFDLTVTFLTFLGSFLWQIIVGRPQGLDVSGPVGIAILTGQVVQLGLTYLIRFTALLSINLAIINILPIPALDGGRILFTLIEKIKGSPVSQRVEQRAHSVGFALLISLMVFVTVRDFMKFDIVEKLKNLF